MSLADLTTEEVALFQMIESGFVGVEHHVTVLRATDSKTGEPCAVLACYKRSVKEGEFIIEPVARLLTNPNEVRDPILEFTETQNADEGVENNAGEPEGS